MDEAVVVRLAGVEELHRAVVAAPVAFVVPVHYQFLQRRATTRQRIECSKYASVFSNTTPQAQTQQMTVEETAGPFAGS
jgi:hypothetical protein